MKKIVVFSLIFVFALTVLAGCTDTGSPQPNANESISPSATTGVQSEALVEPVESGGVTLDAIRKAAEDSGFNVYDEHQLVFLSEVKNGFSVEITADSQTTVYSFIECETEDAAIKNAKDIDNAG